MKNIFEKLDHVRAQIKEEKRKKKYRLGLYDKLYTDGHLRTMKNATLTYLILGDKCTSEVTFNGEQYYLVYGGRFSETIISELVEITGKSRNTIWRELRYLKKIKRIDFETRDGFGTRIVVKPIPDAFQRRFKESKELSQNEVGKNGQDLYQNEIAPMSKQDSTYVKMKQQVVQNGVARNGVDKEKLKEIKENSETGKNEVSLTKTYTKTYTKTEETTTTQTGDVAAVVSEIFKDTVKADKVKDKIQGKNPDEVIALAHYCQEESNAKNPVGLFFTMLEEGTKPPAPAKKLWQRIKPPAGGYQSGEEPLDEDESVPRVEKAEPEVEERKGGGEESDEEFERRRKEDVERIRKQCKSNSVGEPLYKQLERLKIRKLQK